MKSNTLSDAGAKIMNHAHRLILTLSGNRLLAKPFGMALVELHTTGRKSGLPRSCYLTSPVHDSQRVVLVASKGAAWFRGTSSKDSTRRVSFSPYFMSAQRYLFSTETSIIPAE